MNNTALVAAEYDDKVKQMFLLLLKSLRFDIDFESEPSQLMALIGRNFSLLIESLKLKLLHSVELVNVIAIDSLSLLHSFSPFLSSSAAFLGLKCFVFHLCESYTVQYYPNSFGDTIHTLIITYVPTRGEERRGEKKDRLDRSQITLL
jgi:hypothetical protein